MREHTVSSQSRRPSNGGGPAFVAEGYERWTKRDFDRLARLIAAHIKAKNPVGGAARRSTVVRSHKPLTMARVSDPSSDTEADAVLAVAVGELHTHLDSLDTLRREIVCRNFGIGHPQQGIRRIADDLGISRMTAYRLCQTAVEDLRVAFGLAGEAPPAPATTPEPKAAVDPALLAAA